MKRCRTDLFPNKLSLTDQRFAPTSGSSPQPPAPSHSSRTFVLLLAVMLSACSVGPTFEAPSAALPERWDVSATEGVALKSSIDADGALEQRWWTQFGDPVLIELIDQARQTNLDVRIAALRVAQTRAQRNAVAGNRMPDVAARASYQRQRQSEFGSGTRLIDAIGIPGERDAIIDVLSEPHDIYQAGFDASWELDFWGRLRRALEAADASLAASSEDFHAAEVAVIAEVARTYLEVRGVQDQLRIALDSVKAGEETLQLTELLAQRGAVTQLDVVSQRAQLADSRARVPQLEQRRTQLVNALALLLGQEPGALDARLSDARDVPAPPVDVGVGIPSELARRRPDIRGAEARLQAATADVGVAVADLYPRITLTGGFLFEALDAENLDDWGARQWQIGPALYLPIFDGGRRRSVVELRELQQQEAAINYQRTVLRAWHEIDNALSAYVAEQRRTQELAEAVTASRDAYELATMRYEHGMTNFLVALDAQRTLLQAEQAFSESTTTVSTQLVAIYKALGGGWE
jgi:NodT family efflux transporter outer membrane factor (OMF) lipoprotein